MPDGTNVKVERLKAKMSYISLRNGEKSCILLKSGEAEATTASPFPPGLLDGLKSPHLGSRATYMARKTSGFVNTIC